MIIFHLQELRNGFDAEAIQTGKPRLLLSAAVTARRGDINIRYDVPEYGEVSHIFTIRKNIYEKKKKKKKNSNIIEYII